MPPSSDGNPPQQPMPPGNAAPVPAAIEDDDIPFTGEEDPLAEVSTGAFAEVVAEFSRSEQRAKAAK